MNDEIPRLQWLQSFAVFAQTESFTQAADALGLSQPALHTQIKQLSAWAKEPLYLREGRGLGLTERGRDVQRLANTVLGEVSRFRKKAETLEEPVLVSAGRGTHLYLLAEPLRRWVDRGGRLRLRSEGAEQARRSVLSGVAHLAVTPLDHPDPRLRSAPFRTCDLVVVMREDHPLAHQRHLSIQDLSGQPLIVPPPNRPHREALQAAGVAPSISLEVEGWDLMVHYAAMGLGMAVVNDYVPIAPGTVRVPLGGFQPIHLRVVMAREGLVPESTRTLFEMLRR